MSKPQGEVKAQLLHVSTYTLRDVIDDTNLLVDGIGGFVLSASGASDNQLVYGLFENAELLPQYVEIELDEKHSQSDETCTALEKCIVDKKDLCRDQYVLVAQIMDDKSQIGYFCQVFFRGFVVTDFHLRAIKQAAQRLSLEIERTKLICPLPSSQRASERQLSLLNEIGAISKTGGWEVDLTSGSVSWTDEMYQLYGIDKSTPLSMELSMSYFPEEDRKHIVESFNNVIRRGDTYRHEGKFHRQDGTELWVKTTAKPRISNGRVTHVYGALEDISEQYRLLETEHNYTSYLAAILDNLNDAVVTIDEQGTIITTNKAVEVIFGHQQEDVIGEDVTMLMPQSYASIHHQSMSNYIETGEAKILGFGRELVAKHKSGNIFPIELSLSEVIQDGQRQFIGIIKDITERKKALEEIYRIAYFDELTKLPNLKSFARDLDELIVNANYSGEDIYCCLIDIDNFAQYNLAFGKQMGDSILTIVASRINEVITEEFKAYRGIGDNFIILCTSLLTVEIKSDLINRIEWALHNSIQQEIDVDGVTHNITTSLASVSMDSQTSSYEKITGILAFGKKRAKKQGLGGRVNLDKSAFEDYARHNHIRHSFTKAFANGEFYLMLQPQFDVNDNISCSEALLRWEHGQLGMISPVEFIPIAEESDTIIEIGNWVLNEACRLLASCKDKGVETCVAVNISGRHIVRADFAKTLVSLVREWKLEPSMLRLEITETTLVSSIDLVRERIELLSELGFTFSIDDFGTGYSSLSYLKELPISELKIDRYFIDEINFNGDDVPIVNSIIDLADAMGVYTVAEGIENRFQLEYLKSRGCNFFQGFHLSRPIPEKAWLDVIQQNLSIKSS